MPLQRRGDGWNPTRNGIQREIGGIQPRYVASLGDRMGCPGPIVYFSFKSYAATEFLKNVGTYTVRVFAS